MNGVNFFYTFAMSKDNNASIKDLLKWMEMQEQINKNIAGTFEAHLNSMKAIIYKINKPNP
jgi:hypothetical protein